MWPFDALDLTVQPPDIRHGTPQTLPLLDISDIEPQLGTSGHHLRPAQTCSLEDPPCPPLLTSIGHQRTNGWQAGSTHPTANLSCLRIILSEIKASLISCSRVLPVEEIIVINTHIGLLFPPSHFYFHSVAQVTPISNWRSFRHH